MDAFLRSVRSTPIGEIARVFKLHPGLLYTDEKSRTGGKEALNGDSGICTPTSTVLGDKESEKEVILVQWAGVDDENHPKNYSTLTKTLVSFNVFVLTFMTYMVSSIYTPGISGPGSAQEDFDVSLTTGVLGLSLYVIAYGVGPVFSHALIENPRIGRLPVYLASTLLFFTIQIATVYSPNIQTLLALRFLAGFIGSPSLATGGASLGDIHDSVGHTRAISFWAFGAVFGPCIGPVLGGFAFEWAGWRGTIWVSVMTAGFALCCVFLSMPETLAPAIIHRRAQRLQAADPTKICVTVSSRNRGTGPGPRIDDPSSDTRIRAASLYTNKVGITEMEGSKESSDTRIRAASLYTNRVGITEMEGSKESSSEAAGFSSSPA